MKKTPNKKIIIISLAILVIVIIAGYFISRRIGQTNKTEVPITGQQVSPKINNEPKEIFAYQGKVQSIGDNEIIILVTPAFNSVNQDTMVTVKISKMTSIEQLQFFSAQTTRAKGQPPAPPKLKHTPLSFSDIKVGNTVIVSTGANIKNQTEFTASRIEAIE